MVLRGCGGSEPAPWLAPSDDGTVRVDRDMIREYFLEDCDDVTTEQALTRPNAAVDQAFHAATSRDRLAAEAGDLPRVHSRPSDPCRGAAPTRQTQRPRRRA